MYFTCGLRFKKVEPRVVKPYHIHLRDGVQTLDLNIHSNRNWRA